MNYRGIQGFDISTWQDSPTIAGHVDFERMKVWGANFVIIRAGQGNWCDPDFATSWANAKGVLPRSSYWYYDNRYLPQDQARKYYDTLWGTHDFEGMCFLDLEDRQAGIYAGWRAWYDFIEEFKVLYPAAQIGIYTGFFYWMDYITYATNAQRDYFGKYPLWLANYGATGSDPFNPRYTDVLIPLPWLDYLILQSGTPGIGEDVGVESKDVDYDQFNGGEDVFRQYFRVSGETETPQEGQTMATYQGTVLATVELAIREGPGTTYNKLAGLHYGDKIEASNIVEGWWHLVKVNNAIIDGYSFSNNGAWIKTDAVLPDTPPEVVYPVNAVVTMSDGSEWKATSWARIK